MCRYTIREHATLVHRLLDQLDTHTQTLAYIVNHSRAALEDMRDDHRRQPGISSSSFASQPSSLCQDPISCSDRMKTPKDEPVTKRVPMLQKRSASRSPLVMQKITQNQAQPQKPVKRRKVDASTPARPNARHRRSVLLSSSIFTVPSSCSSQSHSMIGNLSQIDPPFSTLEGTFVRPVPAADQISASESPGVDPDFAENEGEDDAPVYCICQKKSRGVMIGCDALDCSVGWYHIDCLGLKKIPKGAWFCAKCQVQMNS